MDKRFDRITSIFDRQEKRFEDMEKEMKNAQRLAELYHQAQQPRLAVEADVKYDTKTHELTKGVAADDANYGDISPA